MSLKSFRDLEVWQVAMQLVTEVYPLTMAFEHPHRFEIGRQMREAVVSPPSNIAELDTQLEVVQRLSIGNRAAVSQAAATCNRVGRMLNVLITKLSNGPGQ